MSPVTKLHDDTFSFFSPWIALLVRGVNKWICFFMFFDILPHPAIRNKNILMWFKANHKYAWKYAIKIDLIRHDYIGIGLHKNKEKKKGGGEGWKFTRVVVGWLSRRLGLLRVTVQRMRRAIGFRQRKMLPLGSPQIDRETQCDQYFGEIHSWWYTGLNKI